MTFDIRSAEIILRSDARLRQIYDQKYELSFDSSSGKQIGLNRRTKEFVGVWIENTIEVSGIGLSSTAEAENYPPDRPRAHLSAPRLTGPYKTTSGKIRDGNDCLYIRVRDEADFRRILSAYLRSYGRKSA